jgi:hypothetical protein
MDPFQWPTTRGIRTYAPERHVFRGYLAWYPRSIPGSFEARASVCKLLILVAIPRLEPEFLALRGARVPVAQFRIWSHKDDYLSKDAAMVIDGVSDGCTGSHF